MTKHLILSAAALGLLAACGTNPPRPSQESCNLATHSQLVGQNYGAIDLTPGLTHRIISPGQAVTMDFNPNRLNLHVDDKGWIQQVTCG
ncbi:I78 family peptidase inhibitor [Paracoccus siganidrum]|nr:I78 family peptidase inhibitor [Paracoccus siganidrum]